MLELHHYFKVHSVVFTVYCAGVCVYRLVAELQQLVRQFVGISNKFPQRLLKTDSFLKYLITAVHTHGVGRLKNK